MTQNYILLNNAGIVFDVPLFEKTVVTGYDCQIDKALSQFAKTKGLSVVSEEGDKENQIVKSGKFLNIIFCGNNKNLNKFNFSQLICRVVL